MATTTKLTRSTGARSDRQALILLGDPHNDSEMYISRQLTVNS
ncbi:MULTISPECIES: hypothetical protein [Kamptonema]|nr:MULTISPECIES: hypothetical protein [Kamptonema]